MTRGPDSRVYAATLTAVLAPASADAADRAVTLRCPAVGQWREAPRLGALLAPGDALGVLEVLGVPHRLIVPPLAHGVVSALGPAAATSARDVARARVAVAFGDRLVALDPDAAVAAAVAATTASERVADGLSFRAPTSGRYYSRPGPDKPPFVTVGDDIAVGHTVCLLEVMKTFNRVTYGGDELPTRARVCAIRPRDQDDLAAGDVILVLERVPN